MMNRKTAYRNDEISSKPTNEEEAAANPYAGFFLVELLGLLELEESEIQNNYKNPTINQFEH